MKIYLLENLNYLIFAVKSIKTFFIHYLLTKYRLNQLNICKLFLFKFQEMFNVIAFIKLYQLFVNLNKPCFYIIIFFSLSHKNILVIKCTLL